MVTCPSSRAFRYGSVLASLLLFNLVSEKVTAATLDYQFVDVQFSPNGIAEGVLSFDQSSRQFLSGEVLTTQSSTKPFEGARYTRFSSTASGQTTFLLSTAQGTSPFFYRLLLTIDTDAIGSPQINTKNFTLFEESRFGAFTGFKAGERIVTSSEPGVLVLHQSTAAVPEPLGVAGVIFAAGMGALLRRLSKRP